MQGSEIFLKILNKYKNRPILVYGDPDPDGLFALRLMCDFLSMLELKYTVYVNPKRGHGLLMDTTDFSGYLIVAADFAISQEDMQRLVDQNISVLSTDHHEIQDSLIHVVGGSAEGVVLNNQYIFEDPTNKYNSGAGVFYELACELYPEFKSETREAIVGITLLTDVCPIENIKAKAYLQTTFNLDSKNDFCDYLIRSVVDDGSNYEFGCPRLDRNFIDYTLGPRINALLRYNRVQEAVDFVLGHGLERDDVRGSQRYLIDEMSKCVKSQNLSALNIIYVDVQDMKVGESIDIASFLGFLCSHYKNKHGNKSTLGMIVDNGKCVRTSFRGKYSDVHYLRAFREEGLKAEGHPPAFGVKDFVPEKGIWTKLDDAVFDLEVQHEVTVKIIESNNLAMLLRQNSLGLKLAEENCYVRDMYRTYIRYTGKDVQLIGEFFKTEPITELDLVNKVPYIEEKGKKKKYILDKEGNKVVKFLEYFVDGRKVKSFDVRLEEGIILPILEKGYLQLYVKPDISKEGE